MKNYGYIGNNGRFVILLSIFFIFSNQKLLSQNEWLEKESLHFKIIYKKSHSHLAGYLLNCAEKTFEKLQMIFGYSPTEKIVLNTFDLYDYGFGEATSIPQNYIHIEIEPFEPGYENIPYNERFQWIINHELAHIFFNDQSNKAESVLRSLFSKTAPEQGQPCTALFSILTNYNRFSPVWHQEAIAIYLETWLSGGFGRVLGSFDEMYFRALYAEGKEFPSLSELQSVLPNNSFLLDMVSYLYGERFASFLAEKHGNKALLKWYANDNAPFYSNYVSGFENSFGCSLNKSWNDFHENEMKFQKENINKLADEPFTKLSYLSHNAFGWVSQPFINERKGEIYFSFHTKDRLASVCSFKLKDGKVKELFSLPTPSLSQVSSTAFDNETGLYFFTTNNNQLFRDVYVMDVNTGESKVLFRDERVGGLTISTASKTLWGIRHNAGQVSIVYSLYPYRYFETFRTFPVGEEVYYLCISPSGNKLAAVTHKSSGIQELVIVNLQNLEDVKTVYNIGNPENPSWSRDEKRLYFNSYANGVSNIFCYSVKDNSASAITHTIKGLFKPVEIKPDSIFAFEFSTSGFMPVSFSPDNVKRLPAIDYHGQRTFEKNPELQNYLVTISNTNASAGEQNKIYSGIDNIKIQSFVPVVSGFQSSVLLGFFSRIADPLLYHDFSIEADYSVYNKIESMPKFHIKTKYEYKKEFYVGFDYNAPDFYDLFNSRKKGMIGEKYYAGMDYYWIYDNPLKVRQTSEIAYYRGVEYFNENQIPVSQPDFLVAQTSVNSRNLRRSIGSSDAEKGDEFNISAVMFGSDIKTPHLSGQFFGEWKRYFNWIAPHNTLLLQLSSGYRIENDNHFQSKFFFGGFGNREIENADVKQYRKIFMFPGLPLYNLNCDRFIKAGIENIFPPLRFGNLKIGNHFLDYADFSVYSQTLFINSSRGNFWFDVGGQVNFIFVLWYNLETTLSAGAAKAFSANESSSDWFISFKLFRN